MLVVISVSFILCSHQGGGTMGLFELLIRQHTITHAPVCGTRKTNKHLCLLQLEAMYRKSLDATRNGRLALSAHVCVCLCVFFVCFHFIVRKGFRASSLNVFIYERMSSARRHAHGANQQRSKCIGQLARTPQLCSNFVYLVPSPRL